MISKIFLVLCYSLNSVIGEGHNLWLVVRVVRRVNLLKG
jgi:hypothetical protein